MANELDIRSLQIDRPAFDRVFGLCRAAAAHAMADQRRGFGSEGIKGYRLDDGSLRVTATICISVDEVIVPPDQWRMLEAHQIAEAKAAMDLQADERAALINELAADLTTEASRVTAWRERRSTLFRASKIHVVIIDRSDIGWQLAAEMWDNVATARESLELWKASCDQFAIIAENPDGSGLLTCSAHDFEQLADEVLPGILGGQLAGNRYVHFVPAVDREIFGRLQELLDKLQPPPTNLTH